MICLLRGVVSRLCLFLCLGPPIRAIEHLLRATYNRIILCPELLTQLFIPDQLIPHIALPRCLLVLLWRVDVFLVTGLLVVAEENNFSLIEHLGILALTIVSLGLIDRSLLSMLERNDFAGSVVWDGVGMIGRVLFVDGWDT